jgi:alkylation response protein AidB-like acyl-CoA dehydrogenase
MNFNDTPEEAVFRAEVRDFVRREAPDPGQRGADMFVGNKAWTKKLAARNWIAPAWPKEYGGAGLSVMEQFIFNSELAEARAPRPGGIATGFAGPTLIVHGTEEQKEKLLPEILTGEIVWCQGYSEPGAGSDLAALQTRAVRDGDDYVVNGQKIWTSGAQYAKWMILLARTDPDAPKHRGITYFIVDMKSPGVTVRPLINAAYSHEFNEVFFEDVRIPRANIIGDENRGWYLAQTTLSFERSNIGGAVGARQTVEDLVKFARDHRIDHQSTLGHNVSLRHELVERFVEAGVATMMSFKIVSIQAKEGVAPGHEASVAKLYGTELNQRIYRTGMHVLGLYGQLDAKSAGPKPPMNGRINYMYLRSIANTIEGGTSEIQRNIIATRGLGLPRA